MQSDRRSGAPGWARHLELGEARPAHASVSPEGVRQETEGSQRAWPEALCTAQAMGCASTGCSGSGVSMGPALRNGTHPTLCPDLSVPDGPPRVSLGLGGARGSDGTVRAPLWGHVLPCLTKAPSAFSLRLE